MIDFAHPLRSNCADSPPTSGNCAEACERCSDEAYGRTARNLLTIVECTNSSCMPRREGASRPCTDPFWPRREEASRPCTDPPRSCTDPSRRRRHRRNQRSRTSSLPRTNPVTRRGTPLPPAPTRDQLGPAPKRDQLVEPSVKHIKICVIIVLGATGF